jgi:adenine-specific DNA-methyltransferase
MQRQIRLGAVEFREDHTQPPFCKTHLRPIPEELDSDNGIETDEPEGEEELATQVRGTYFYKQSQVAVKYLKRLLGAKVFNNPKDHVELARLFNYVTSGDKEALILDFFAGSGTTGQSVLELNQSDGGKRRFLMVQLPEPLSTTNKDQKAAAKYCDQIGRPRNIAELTKERLRRAILAIKSDSPLSHGDLGFRVFKLDTSNIRAWDPDRDDLSNSLLNATEHIKPDRGEQDVLFELLLKLGLDLTVSIETKTIGDQAVHSIGAGTLFACLASRITREDVEPLALGIAAWHRELNPAGETQVVFRDSAFADDVAKTNLAAILQQNGLENVRSL